VRLSRLRRPEGGPRAVRLPGRPGPGTLGVAAVLAAAGLLFTTSAHTARGTQLRSDRSDLAGLLTAESQRVQAREQRVHALDQEVLRQTAETEAGKQAVGKIEQNSELLAEAAGLRAVSGPGVKVTLDDAPRDSSVPAQATPDDLVVHQQDVQAVVNALWAGGAEAMMLQDQRVISTSAVRCVGNTLILQGRVYSPPYTITAIGDPKRLQGALDRSPEISYYLQYVAALRLGWSVDKPATLHFPAYAGSLALEHATVKSTTSTEPKETP
jgi:uncharacterized protein YlxW (UPF0749 family)